jgi:CRISPR-associated protein Csm1
MDDLQCKVAIGAMLHDIGKVLFRSSDGRNHSRSGYDFLKEKIGIRDKEILDQVLYHHADMIKGSSISADSPAYITYMADNIASAADRREKAEKDTAGFDKTVPLESIFNILEN